MFDSISKYCLYLDQDHKKSLRLFRLLYNIENYTNGAILEIRRLEKHRSQIRKFFKKGIFFRENKFLLTYLALDTHFFFICIDKICKLLHNLYEETNDKEVKKLETQINKIFDITTIRNHLEHIEDRCIGYISKSDKKRKKQTTINDFGNFIGDDFSFHNKKFPSSKKSLEEIKNIYKSLIKITDKRCKKNPDFIKRQEINKEHKKRTNSLRKAGLLS